MSYFLKVLKAEMMKQHRDYFHNKTIYISLFLWPVLTFITAYYGFKPFKMDKVIGVLKYLNEENLILFMLIGYICLMFFQCFVQSAWRFSMERIYGTLELVYLTPANRLAFVMGNAVSSLFESVWLFAVFALAILVSKIGSFNINYGGAIVGLILMIVLSLLWGVMLNSLFLFSRDTGFLFTILQEPVEIFGGVRVPSQVFPLWAKIAGLIFPITYSAEILRRSLLNGEGIASLSGFIFISMGLGILMLAITAACLKLGEIHCKKTGSMSLF
jgi:ABC-2 type transport system permease protein